MPIYEYDCRPCKKKFEKVVTFHAGDKPQACPDCGEPAKRVISKPAPVQWGRGGRPT